MLIDVFVIRNLSIERLKLFVLNKISSNENTVSGKTIFLLVLCFAVEVYTFPQQNCSKPKLYVSVGYPEDPFFSSRCMMICLKGLSDTI
jgi:hypothetical protein